MEQRRWEYDFTGVNDYDIKVKINFCFSKKNLNEIEEYYIKIIIGWKFLERIVARKIAKNDVLCLCGAEMAYFYPSCRFRNGNLSASSFLRRQFGFSGDVPVSDRRYDGCRKIIAVDEIRNPSCGYCARVGGGCKGRDG